MTPRPLKKLPYAIATAALLTASSAAHAQEAPCLHRPNALLADLGLHVINVGYQRTLGCVLAVQASVGLYSPWMVNSNVFGLAGADHDPPGDVLGFAVRARAFVHLFARGPRGLWLSPFAQAGVVRASRGVESLSGTAIAAGLSAGWTWRLGDRWVIALGVGAQYHVVVFDGSARFPGFARFAPTVDINVGYAF